MSQCLKRERSEKKKIHFTPDVTLESHDIVCHFTSDTACQVDLGLLSALHTYEVHFHMNHKLGDEIQIPPLQSPAVEIVSLDKIDGSLGHKVILHVKCMEKAQLNETICFENLSEERLALNLVSRVMPHHLGTPSLKSGIRLLHGSSDAMSDASDWKGFE